MTVRSDLGLDCSDEAFAVWMRVLELEHERIGRPYGDGPLANQTGSECWREFFDNGASAVDALHEDLDYD